jgi:RNA polymerase sigma factor (sigma-70 family)
LADNAEEILRGLSASDPQAWEQLHEQYWRKTLGYVCRKFPDLNAPDLARDIATDTLLAVLEQVRHGTEIKPEALQAYILCVAMRKSYEVVIQKRREVAVDILTAPANARDASPSRRRLANGAPFLSPPCPRPDPEQQCQLASRQEQIRLALQQLSPSDRDILQRYYYSGETVDQIMAAYAYSYTQFRNMKSRALTRLLAMVYGQPASNKRTRTPYTRHELWDLIGESCQH